MHDDACLIRLELGRCRRRAATNTSCFQRFNLRNFPLRIDQMEALNLEAHAYAHAMTNTLAMVHCDAKAGANDVEVLALLWATYSSLVSSIPNSSASTLSRSRLRVLSRNLHERGRCRPSMRRSFKNDPFIHVLAVWVQLIGLHRLNSGTDSSGPVT